MKNEAKQSKKTLKMEVKTLIPWMIILVSTALVIGLTIGWSARSGQVEQIKAEVSQQVQAATVKKQ